MDEAYAVAKGRVWLGVDALPRKLVDRFGGLFDALQTVRAQAGMEDDAVGVRYLGGLGPFSSLQRMVGQVFGLADTAQAAAGPKLPADLADIGAMITALGQGGALAMMPYTIRIAP